MLLHLNQLERAEDAFVDALRGCDHHTQPTHPLLASRMVGHIRRPTTSALSVHCFDKNHFLPTHPAFVKMQSPDKADCPHNGRQSPTLIFL